MTQSRFYTFSKSDVGPSTSKITSNPNIRAREGIYLTASSGNTDDVYIGSSGDITFGSNDETDGFVIYPGSTQILKSIDPYYVYAGSSTSGQKISVYVV